MFNIQKNAFTMVELIVVVTILAILSSIWFVSYTSGISDARDSTRISDIASIQSALKQYQQARWSYPIPSPWDNMTLNVWTTDPIATQGSMNNKVSISTLDRIPSDPKNKLHYSYSITTNRQEYQLAATLENGDTPLALLQWDYSSVSHGVVPTIVLALDVVPWESIDVTDSDYQDLFIFDYQFHNIPYSFIDNYEAVADGINTASDLRERAEEVGRYWQNSDFFSCSEIAAAGKLLGTTQREYQIINPDTWVQENTMCP